MTFQGMDSEIVRAYGRRLVVEADDAISRVEAIRNEMDTIRWTGPDQRLAWNNLVDVLGPLVREIEGIRVVGETVQANADDQDRCSDAQASGSTEAQYEMCREGSPRGEIANYLRALERVPKGKFGVVCLGGDPPRYVVLLRGVSDRISPSNQDWAGAAAAATDLSDPYSAAVAKVLDSLPPGAEVMMVAHSQGGMAAVNASAMTSANVQDIVSIGTGGYKLDHLPSDVNLTAIENSGDLVPAVIRVGQFVSDPISAASELIGSTPDNVNQYMFSDGRINPLHGFGASHDIETYIAYVEREGFYNKEFAGDFESITYYDG